jgi:eukaryotic-like serine/threonine-protein kinase
MINAENWGRISPLLDRALELEPAQRDQWLESLSPEHTDLRDVLRRLLLADSGLETRDLLPRLEYLAESDLAAGACVGPYRLIRQIGTGGMAIVWLAERADGSLRRQVALKLSRMAVLHSGFAVRLAHERDILAALEHPNIARLYDAGVDAEGRPYLALEYVDGMPVDAYSHEHALTLRQRLDLFLQICRAVAFAHGRLVVHRDLKPSNILVNAAGDVRLLDFGIARLLQLESDSNDQHTQFGSRALTPSYAAPEQFLGHPVSAATDVYSLGVLLYELLTGVSPYAPKRSSPGALEQAVLEHYPALASSVAQSANRRALRGDLDSILVKALRKIPQDRYSSVDAFASDIERHLAGQPIATRSASRWYLARTFARRYALALGFATAVVAALAVGLAIAVWQWKAAARQRVIATEHLAQTRATLDFTRAVLREGVERDETVTLDTLLARSEAMAEGLGWSDVETRIAATDFVTDWYFNFGLNTKVEGLLTRTLNEMPASGHVSAKSRFICRRALVRSYLGQRDEGIAVLMSEIERNADDADTASYCLQLRAWIARDSNDAPGTLAFYREALRRADEAGGQSLSERSGLVANIAGAYALGGQADEAQKYYEQAFTLLSRAGRAESVVASGILGGWGVATLSVGNPLQALGLFERSLGIAKRRSPTKSPRVITVLNRAITLSLLARYAEATAAYDTVARSADTDDVASALSSKADIARRLHRLDEAQGLLDSAAAKLSEARLPAGSPVVLRQKQFQAQVWTAQGRLTEATALLTELIDHYTALGCCGGARSRALLARSAAAAAGHRLDVALADAQQALDLARKTQGSAPFSNFTGNAWLAIGHLREAQGHAAEAREAYRSAAAHLARTVGEQHPDTLEARRAGESL